MSENNRPSTKQPYSIAVLAVGYELLSGQVVDSNSAWIGESLESSDLFLREIRVCDDVESEIVAHLAALFETHDAVIVSGGLGPTTDDLTREAVARFLDLPLELNQRELEKIKEIFRSRNRPFFETNNKQALIPKGASVIENPTGTAPGFSIQREGQGRGRSKSIFVLPGVPRELKLMFRFAVLPELLKLSGVEPVSSHALFRIFGMSESQIGEIVEKLGLDSALRTSYRAHFPEIRLGLHANLGSKRANDALIAESTEKIRGSITDEYIFSTSGELGLERVVHDLLQQGKQTVSVAESCTGGMLGMLLTEHGGASDFFLGGVQSYSNEIKSNILNVEGKVLSHFGAVSAEVAEMMALGVRRLTGSKLSLSITGVAGPDGGSTEKPVGLYFVGFASESESHAFRFFYPGNRDLIRRYASFCALDILRRHLLKLPLRAKNIP